MHTAFCALSSTWNDNRPRKQVEPDHRRAGSGHRSRWAEQIAKNRRRPPSSAGMGPNQFFNADLKDRAILLVAALTRNLGFPGGNVGSCARQLSRRALRRPAGLLGRGSFQSAERPQGQGRDQKYLHYESLHYYNYGDRPLRAGNTLFTGKGHPPRRPGHVAQQ